MSESKEWTLMFYFASDNPLAPGIVSQLKALKNAGYHPDVNVIAYFDPQPAGTPAHIFDVNYINKLKDPHPRIGFRSNDPYVRGLMQDRLWGDELSGDGTTTIRELIKRLKMPGLDYEPPKPSPPKKAARNRAGAKSDKSAEPGSKSLSSFLDFCADNYKADHYMLFILGHGLVVGNDVFLYDEHASKHSVTLKELGKALEGFKAKIGEKAELELVSFHSCSMSSLEVAYELQGSAKHMLASQGPAFVASWPYTQILISVFNQVKRGRAKTENDIQEMIGKITSYVFYNSKDFMLAGYSFDICLCDLSKVTEIEDHLGKLSRALIRGLKDEMVKNCILLAHLKSQSYWGENYTDLYDFCSCLQDYCKKFAEATGQLRPYQRIMDECDRVMGVLEKRSLVARNNPIWGSGSVGPDSQYSHGFSVFFPWTRPVADKTIMKDYEDYKFKSTHWFKFLENYWGLESETNLEYSTMRVDPKIVGAVEEEDPLEALDHDMESVMFNAAVPLDLPGALSGGDKPHPTDPTGDECTCGSIKNYLRDTRPRGQRSQSAKPKTVPVNQSNNLKRKQGKP